MSTGSWILIAAVVVVVVVAVALAVTAGKRKRQEADRSRAAELRDQAATQTVGIEQREAHVRETEARAETARAEAEQKLAQAERLEAEAQDRRSTVGEYRARHADSLREADEIDPDVPAAAPVTESAEPMESVDQPRHREV